MLAHTSKPRAQILCFSPLSEEPASYAQRNIDALRGLYILGTLFDTGKIART